MLLKGELCQPGDYMTSIINPYTTDGVTVMSLHQETSMATDCLCQILLNQKLLHTICAILQ